MDAMTTRRQLLAGGVGLAGAALLAGCGPAPEGPRGEGPSGVLQWWDHSPNLQDANKAVFAEYEADGGLQVEYSYYQTAKLGQALTLAKQSGQLPDAFTNVGLELPLPQLIDEGWFQPAKLTDQARTAIGDGNLVEGIHQFEGEVYSFPIANPRQYWASPWFNSELVQQAGLDPSSPPTTFDEFRSAAKAVVDSGNGAQGVVLNIGMPDRMATQVDHLAVSAGFEGQGGVLFATGEFAYDSDPYLQVMEFLVSLNTDKLVMPGSVQFDDKVARQRWATGTVGYYLDGPWCPGVVSKDAAPFLPKVDVGRQLVPESGQDPVMYRPPQGGMFYVGGSSKVPDEVSNILSRIALPQYQLMISNGMAQPPLDMSLVAKSDAHPSYKKNIANFTDTCFLAPTPVVRNPDISAVSGRIKPVKPGLGEIIQGVFSGQVKDWKAALTKLSSDNMAAREKAMQEVTASGAKVSQDDYAFSNWKPRQDYTKQMYG